MAPKVSVIIPFYNAERTISRCIKSVMSQRMDDFECLLIDDGSTDKSKIICQKYIIQDKRFHLFHKKNGGVSSARNVGLNNATGEWIAFIDADDWVGESWLSNFINHAHNVDCVVQGINVVDQNGKETNHLLIKNFIYSGQIIDCIPKFLETRSLGYLVTKIFKKEIIDKAGLRLNETFRFKEDEEFVIRYFKIINSISVISDGDYFYQAPNNIKEKYSTIDNYPCINSMLMSIKEMFPKDSDVRKAYFKSTVEALFQAYKTQNPQRKAHLKSFLENHSDDFQDNQELLSSITWMSLKLNNLTIISFLLDIKSAIAHIIHKTC